MSEATISALTIPAAAKDPPHLASLIEDAEYVCLELARGDAVPANVLVKAKAFIDPVMKAALAAKSAPAPGDTEYRTFQSAMVDLMTAIAPVTVSSLQDTETSADPVRSLFLFRWVMRLFGVKTKYDASPAERFGDNLMVASVAFLLAALGCTLAVQMWPDNTFYDLTKALVADLPKTYSGLTGKLNSLLGNYHPGINAGLVAFQTIFYGGLGACVFLLRSLHKHIHERTFDRRFQPEYYNRIVLGVVGGGVITILINADGKAPTGTLAGISIPALAFLVGYNTDLLFSLIERISNALFPKVPDPPSPEAAVMPPSPAKKTGDGDGADGQ